MSTGGDNGQVLEADLTWTGESFEPGVRVEVTGDGRIAALHRVGDGAEPSSGEEVLRLRHRALLPGFVNAHSHAFQRGLRGRGETFPEGAGSFWTWREAMYALVSALDEEGFVAVCRRAFAEMRAAGITCVGEFHYFHHATAEGEADFRFDELVLEAARAEDLRIVLLQAFYASGGIGAPLEGGQRRFRTPSPEVYWKQMSRLESLLEPETQGLGAVVHSIRAAAPEDLQAVAAEARRRGLVLHLHLEEQRQEIEACQEAYGCTPMQLLLDRVEVSPDVTAVHCTHTAKEDMARYGAAGGRICLCPLTEANLGDGLAAVEVARDSGAGLCLGTDSNARISMLEEARWLEYGQRLRGERRGVLRSSRGDIARPLLSAATEGGAAALGLEGRIGRLAPGAWADLVAIDLRSPSLEGWSANTLLATLLLGCGDDVIAATAVGGRWRPRAS